jgi:anaerobic selenocysteine-containing dehydrogenase
MLALHHDPQARFAVGPVPTRGADRTFADGFTMCAEKAPNTRGVRRVLDSVSPGTVLDMRGFQAALKGDGLMSLLITGNHPSQWVTDDLTAAIEHQPNRFVVLIDTLPGALLPRADVVLPGATWVEKAGTFENAGGRLQSFHRAIEPIDYCKGESQIALDLLAAASGTAVRRYDAALTRREMAEAHGLTEMVGQVHHPPGAVEVEPDMQYVEI